MCFSYFPLIFHQTYHQNWWFAGETAETGPAPQEAPEQRCQAQPLPTVKVHTLNHNGCFHVPLVFGTVSFNIFWHFWLATNAWFVFILNQPFCGLAKTTPGRLRQLPPPKPLKGTRPEMWVQACAVCRYVYFTFFDGIQQKGSGRVMYAYILHIYFFCMVYFW